MRVQSPFCQIHLIFQSWRGQHSKVILIKKDDLKYWEKDYILVKNPYLAFSKIATLFNELSENEKNTIHESVIFGKNSKPERK